jgi:hypothetical protein
VIAALPWMDAICLFQRSDDFRRRHLIIAKREARQGRQPCGAKRQKDWTFHDCLHKILYFA